jgi:hypothetical protein
MSHKITGLTAIFILCASTTVFAQSKPIDEKPTDNPSGNVTQPQGKTGPINTKSEGGAPASSPQGETPPGMQSAPNGSRETIRTDKDGGVEGTPKN